MNEEKESLQEDNTLIEHKVTKLRKKSNGVSPIIFVLSLIAAILTTYVVVWTLLNSTYSQKIAQLTKTDDSLVSKITNKLTSVNGVIQDNYLYELDEEQIIDYALKGYMAGIGDKYGEYYTVEEFKSLSDYAQGEMEGIGVSVYYDTDYDGIRVLEVYKDSPAEKAGIVENDLIMYVLDEDGEYYSISYYGYTLAMSKLRGVAGTTADFILYRESEGYSEAHTYSVLREHFVASTVSYRIHSEDSTVGIVRISQFGDNTADEFISIMDSLQKQGVDKFIFDVRSNPGGELTAIGRVLDYLLPEGPIARTIDKDGNEEIVYQSDSKELIAQMAVVCNGKTASAGELFCAALRDYEKAKIVGTTTYGKGSMQTVRTFPDGTAFKFTYRYYCPPYSDNYDGVGVVPDITIELSEEHQNVSVYSLADTEDEQIVAAYAELYK